MSQSSADKSEKATPQKQKKSREQGQIPRSRELSSAGLLLAGGLLLENMVPRIGTFLSSLMKGPQTFNWQENRDPTMMTAWFGEALVYMAWALLPLFCLLLLLIIGLNIYPGGFVFNGKKLLPSAKKLNPLSGLARMFSSKSLVELLKSVLKVSLMAMVLHLLLDRYWPLLMRMSSMPLLTSMELALTILGNTLFYLGLAQLLVALIDVPYQLWSNSKQIKMTKQEVKDEHKNTQGNPQIKARIRQVQRMISQQRIDTRVPEADVIIINPTHYAVAIKYSVDQANAPFVIAKGVDEMALRVRQIAQQHNKVILSLPDLTRAIYYSTKVDQEVPAGLYTAIAHVLNHVLLLDAYQRGRGKKPKPLGNIFIPPELRQ